MKNPYTRYTLIDILIYNLLHEKYIVRYFLAENIFSCTYQVFQYLI